MGGRTDPKTSAWQIYEKKIIFHPEQKFPFYGYHLKDASGDQIRRVGKVPLGKPLVGACHGNDDVLVVGPSHKLDAGRQAFF